MVGSHQGCHIHKYYFIWIPNQTRNCFLFFGTPEYRSGPIKSSRTLSGGGVTQVMDLRAMGYQDTTWRDCRDKKGGRQKTFRQRKGSGAYSSSCSAEFSPYHSTRSTSTSRRSTPWPSLYRRTPISSTSTSTSCPRVWTTATATAATPDPSHHDLWRTQSEDITTTENTGIKNASGWRRSATAALETGLKEKNSEKRQLKKLMTERVLPTTWQDNNAEATCQYTSLEELIPRHPFHEEVGESTWIDLKVLIAIGR